MASFKSSGSFKPFKDLDKLIPNPLHSVPSKKAVHAKKNKYNIKVVNPPKQPQHLTNASVSEDEQSLFFEAMADVKPLLNHPRQVKISGTNSTTIEVQDQTNDTESEILMRLNRLIEHGEGFVVSDTSEYAEWTGFNVNPWITQRLHRGDFTIQGYIDLHGFTVQEAKAALDAFLKDSIATKKHAVLIVHGRGLSSPFEPVLKSRVYEWLTRGEYNKWIVAFSSARLSDGGAGATVVLLRRYPISKRFKKWRKKHT